MLFEMMGSFEASYRSQYAELPQDFKDKMLKGIVAFEIVASRLEGKHKLSQNKSIGEQARIADALVAQADQDVAEVGRLMHENLGRV